MSLSDVRTKLAARLDTISGLNVYKQAPDAGVTTPCAVLEKIESIDYHETFGGGKGITLRVILLVHEGDSTADWDELENYLEESGTKSILAAVEGTSGGAPAVADYAQCHRAENIGWYNWRGQTWLGAEFIVEVKN